MKPVRSAEVSRTVLRMTNDETRMTNQCPKPKYPGQTHLNRRVLSLTPRLQPGVAALTPAFSRFNGFSGCKDKPLKRLGFLYPTIHRAEAPVLMKDAVRIPWNLDACALPKYPQP